ncbi:MAG: DUF805 domain-containing protein [Rhodocyclaceae bacterium]|nr:DUF805 domain-containing protein [Rhodocyclaceae bacterium]
MNDQTRAVNPFAAPAARLDGPQAGVDAEFKLNLFSTAGRIGRLRYIAYGWGIAFVIMAVAGLLAAFTHPAVLGLGYLVLIVLQVMLTVKRCHDFNASGWLALLMFVPIANLIVIFYPGTDGPNRFGNKTPPNGKVGMIVGLLLVIAVIGILAAVAIPAYQDYVMRARAAAGR